jgi:hypothetical protein
MEFRETLVLRDVQSLGYHEIAELTGVPVVFGDHFLSQVLRNQAAVANKGKAGRLEMRPRRRKAPGQPVQKIFPRDDREDERETLRDREPYSFPSPFWAASAIRTMTRRSVGPKCPACLRAMKRMMTNTQDT